MMHAQYTYHTDVDLAGLPADFPFAPSLLKHVRTIPIASSRASLSIFPKKLASKGKCVDAVACQIEYKNAHAF